MFCCLSHKRHYCVCIFLLSFYWRLPIDWHIYFYCRGYVKFSVIWPLTYDLWPAVTMGSVSDCVRLKRIKHGRVLFLYYKLCGNIPNRYTIIGPPWLIIHGFPWVSFKHGGSFLLTVNSMLICQCHYTVNCDIVCVNYNSNFMSHIIKSTSKRLLN